MVSSVDAGLESSESSDIVCFVVSALVIGSSSENDTFFGVRIEILSELTANSRYADDWLNFLDGFIGDESRLPLAFRDTGIEPMAKSPDFLGGRVGCNGSEQSLNFRLSHFTA